MNIKPINLNLYSKQNKKSLYPSVSPLKTGMTIIKMAHWWLFNQKKRIPTFPQNNSLITHQHFSCRFG
ncbi:hypothetical protein CEQ36_20060 [Yersinia intermedia]|nr:hypothetical protein A6J67_07280 [Yersinia sp. FDAARGOS_228]AVL37641.1 hypothetical protein CEQ36_20060 [Yersinia intermedia]OWF92721.1 hypothetical protein B4916_01950 [Yersinia intermedia]